MATRVVQRRWLFEHVFLSESCVLNVRRRLSALFHFWLRVIMHFHYVADGSAMTEVVVKQLARKPAFWWKDAYVTLSLDCDS